MFPSAAVLCIAGNLAYTSNMRRREVRCKEGGRRACVSRCSVRCAQDSSAPTRGLSALLLTTSRSKKVIRNVKKKSQILCNGPSLSVAWCPEVLRGAQPKGRDNEGGGKGTGVNCRASVSNIWQCYVSLQAICFSVGRSN